MDFAGTIERVRSNPGEFLSGQCVLAFGAFLFGYKTTDASAVSVLTMLDEEFDGPDQADACTRAYLSSPTSEEGLRRVLDAIGIVVQRQSPAPLPGPGASKTFISFVREAIERGRPAMVLAEPTTDWLYNFFRGYHRGLEAVSPDLAAQQWCRVEAFEEWLRDSYGHHTIAPWHGILRVYEGACERGLSRFVELWDDFERECLEENGA